MTVLKLPTPGDRKGAAGATNGAVASPPAPSIFDDPDLDPELRLRRVLEAQRRAHDEWDEACRLADDIDPEDQPDELEMARRNVRNGELALAVRDRSFPARLYFDSRALQNSVLFVGHAARDRASALLRER